MARGARSNRAQANRSALRKKLFAPHEMERAKRLHARLIKDMENSEKVIDTSSTDAQATAADAETLDKDILVEENVEENDEKMDIDETELATEVGAVLRKKRMSLKERRKEKKLNRRKPKNRVTFPKKKISRRREPRI